MSTLDRNRHSFVNRIKLSPDHHETVYIPLLIVNRIYVGTNDVLTWIRRKLSAHTPTPTSLPL